MRACKTVLAVLAFVFAAAAGAFAFDPSTPPAERNAILISWDGAQRAHVKECLKRKELPNLARLIREGKLVDIDVAGHQTDTKAGHTQMLTGYNPNATGVYSNSRYRPIPFGYSIFEDLQKTFGRTSITTIMVTAKTHHIGSLGAGEKLPAAKGAGRRKAAVAEDEETARVKPRLRAQRAAVLAAQTNKQGEPWFNVKKSLTVWDGDRARTADQVGPLDLMYLDRYAGDRFFAFFHFSDPDHKGHQSGENSKQYNQALIDCDRWLGKLMQELKRKRIAGKTMVFVTADHGFDEGMKTHKKAPYVFLGSDDPAVVQNGTQRDIVPTLLAEMGADPGRVTPKFPGHALVKQR